MVSMRDNVFHTKSWVAVFATTLSLFVANPSLAQSFPLQTIDLISNAGSTEVLLHTGSIVPYQTVLATDNKVVIDVDNVDPDQTIRTNFSQAKNVSHVILQPLTNNKIRLIVRGEDLGQPVVAFRDAAGGVTNNAAERLQSQFRLPEARSNSSELQSSAAPAAPVFDQGITNTTSNNNNHDADLVSNTSRAASEPITLPSSQSAQQVQRSFWDSVGLGSMSQWLPNASNPLEIAGIVLQLSILIGIFAAFIYFIRHKLSQLQGEAQDDRQMAEYNANMSPTKRQTRSAGRNPMRHLNEQNQSEEMIGLGSMRESSNRENHRAGLRNSRLNEDGSPMSRPENNINSGKAQKPANTNTKLAASHYQKQAQTPPSRPNRLASGISEDLIKQEIQRSADIKRMTQELAAGKNNTKTPKAPTPNQRSLSNNKPAANAPATAKKGNAQNSGGNPEVLDFLRSVAELMEKDGNAQMARSIHKNLGRNINPI
ncbi:MAG: AMIN domain-containing protein [Cyanobacteria bacterium]|nr:AMIN domain-containing protein [Cyanobacteriota bacterium]